MTHDALQDAPTRSNLPFGLSMDGMSSVVFCGAAAPPAPPSHLLCNQRVVMRSSAGISLARSFHSSPVRARPCMQQAGCA